MSTALIAPPRPAALRSLVAVAGAFAVIAAMYLLRAPADWGKVYLPAARRLAGGQELFTVGYLYPPAFAWLILPLTKLPPIAELLARSLLNALSLCLILALAWRVSGADRLAGRRERTLAALAAAGLAGPFLMDALTNQQNDLVVIALVLGGCALLRRQAPLRAACLLGLAAGIKCTPLLWAPYLLWRRRVLAALLLIGVAVGINLLPDWTHPPEGTGPRVLWWGRHCVLATVRDREPGVWGSAIEFNHSLAGVCNRLLIGRRKGGGETGAADPSSGRVSPEALRHIVRGLGLALLAAAAAASWRARSRAGVSPREVERYEFGLVVCLMVLLSPMSSKPHFGVLVLPVLALARRAVSRRDPLTVAYLALAGCAAALSNKDLTGTALYDWTLWHGSVGLVSLALFAGCLAALLRAPAPPAGSLGGRRRVGFHDGLEGRVVVRGRLLEVG